MKSIDHFHAEGSVFGRCFKAFTTYLSRFLSAASLIFLIRSFDSDNRFTHHFFIWFFARLTVRFLPSNFFCVHSVYGVLCFGELFEFNKTITRERLVFSVNNHFCAYDFSILCKSLFKSVFVYAETEDCLQKF